VTIRIANDADVPPGHGNLVERHDAGQYPARHRDVYVVGTEEWRLRRRNGSDAYVRQAEAECGEVVIQPIRLDLNGVATLHLGDRIAEHETPERRRVHSEDEQRGNGGHGQPYARESFHAVFIVRRPPLA
jgi:hypothetical protein